MQEEEPNDQQNDTGEDQQGRHVGQGAYEPVKEGPTRRIPGGKDQNQGRQKERISIASMFLPNHRYDCRNGSHSCKCFHKADP